MLPTPAPTPTIDPCNHPPAIVTKAPMRSYGIFPVVVIPAGRGPGVLVSDWGQPQRLPLTATLDVFVSTLGTPMEAIVIKSSDDSSFDRAAIDVAMRSTYTPGKTNCVAQRMHYTFVETLGPAL